MSRRTTLFCLLAALAAVLFIRLGFWQLSRLHERRARNAAIADRQHGAPVPFLSLPHDTGAAHYRPALVEGRYDYDHELVLTARTRRGAPGVELLTPVRLAGRDTAVVVNRGWVYSPDGATMERARWRERDSARVSGFVELFVPDVGSPTSGRDPRVIRHATMAEVAAKVPYPVAPYYLVATGDTVLTHPARRELPALDDGPHRSYAIQWFCFAAIAVGGAIAVVMRERRG